MAYKAKKFMSLLLAAFRKNYGPSPRLTQWIYERIVRPMVSYASIVWGHCVNTARMKICMQRLDRKALLAIAQDKLSTPTEGLKVIYDLMPLEIFLQESAIKSYVR